MRNFLLWTFAVAWSSTASAQQTVFNVPNSDLTPQRKILFQQQVEFNREQFRSTTTVTYGLGRGWEAGLNLYNLDYLPPERTWFRNDTTTQVPFAPLLLANAQKVFELNQVLSLGIGGQAGLDLAPLRTSQFAGWGYANLVGSLAREHYQLAIGAYSGNPRYLGEGPSAGFHVAVDAGVIYEKFHLLSDWASGSNAYGQLTLGFEVFLGEHLPLSLGWQRSNEDGQQALVLQLTYMPK